MYIYIEVKAEEDPDDETPLVDLKPPVASEVPADLTCPTL